tara:strand:- start:1187 stop:1459 length:273 start_codon:yes stop_codon:yes gene_type:complete
VSDELIDAAELGEEAKRFKQSDLYKSLIGFAQQETMAALDELSRCEPTDTKKIMELQNQAAIGRKFPDWINEIIHLGDEALEVWKQQNTE